MVEDLLKKIDELLKTSSPKDIKIIMTEDDDITNYFIKKYLDEKNIKTRFLSGTKRIYEDKACFCSLIILMRANYNTVKKRNQKTLRRPPESPEYSLLTNIRNFRQTKTTP